MQCHLLFKTKLRIDSRGIAMHSENLRIDAESFLDLRCIDVFSQPYWFGLWRYEYHSSMMFFFLCVCVLHLIFLFYFFKCLLCSSKIYLIKNISKNNFSKFEYFTWIFKITWIFYFVTYSFDGKAGFLIYYLMNRKFKGTTFIRNRNLFWH